MTETTIHESLRPLAIPIDQLHFDPANARKHDQRNLDAIAGSLAKFGQRKPIVVQRQGMIVRAGNGSLAAARSLGWTKIAAVVVDEDDVAATAFAIADNRTAELASWDEDVLGDLLASLRDDPDFDHLLTGFTDAEIARLEGAVEGRTDPDEVPDLPEEATTEPGDLWVLGDHRLLCGDATSPEDVERLLDGAEPFLMVTDPPYGVSYDPAWRNESGIASTKRTGKVTNDDRVDWTDAYRLFTGDVLYLWHAARHAGPVAGHVEDADFEIRAQLIWRKPRFAISRGAYHWGHEPAWYAVRRGRTARWCGDRTQSTVWDVPGVDDTGTTRHGTQKPVECMERPMRNHGEPGDLVYDPFLGSGTSIVAAERCRRRCYGLEIDPRYCDVIVSRWEAYTGEKAERVQPEVTS